MRHSMAAEEIEVALTKRDEKEAEAAMKGAKGTTRNIMADITHSISTSRFRVSKLSKKRELILI